MRWFPRALVLWPALFLVLMVAAPMLRLAWEGMSLPAGGWGAPAPEALSDTSAFSTSSLLAGLATWRANLAAVWLDDYLRFRLLWSLAQAALSTALTGVLGLPVAWVLARFDFVGRSWVLRLLMLPFVVPTLVAALGILALWGPDGWFSAPLGLALEDTPWLLILGNLFFNLCLVVRAGVDALAQVSASRLAAARTLGATPWRAFWRVEWPAIRLAVASALCLVFLYCFSGMGLALVLGGQRWATAEVEIYTLVAHELRLAEASALALWSMGFGAVLAGAYALLARHLAQPLRADRVALRRVTTAGQRGAVALALAVLGVASVLPLLASVGRALADVPALWQVWTDADTWAALSNTLRFSGLTLLAATALGLAQGLAAHHWGLARPGWPRRVAVLIQASGFVPFVASPVTVAFGLLLLYPDWSASLVLLVAAYTLLAYPFVAQNVTQGLASLPPAWGQAAQTLGARPWRVFVRVTLPLLAPALRRGMAFAAATALGEFAVSLFLSRPEWVTLTTLIYQHLGRPGEANVHAAHALSLLLMGLALGVFVLLDQEPNHA
jgi:thiamine transport system permease protein